MSEAAKLSWMADLNEIGSFALKDEEVERLSLVLDAPINEEARSNLDGAVNNYLAFCALCARGTKYQSKEVKGRAKPTGGIRHASPILSFLKATEKLAVQLQKIEDDNASADFLAHYEAEETLGQLPDLAAVVGMLQSHSIRMNCYLNRSENRSNPFNSFVKHLDSIYTGLTGKQAGLSNTPGQKFAIFVRELDRMLPAHAQVSINSVGGDNPDSDPETAWAQRVYRALRIARKDISAGS